MDTIKWLENILSQCENFTITEALKESKNTFDLLCIINYLLDNVIDLTRYEIETKQEQKDFEELKKIKDKILKIKNRNINMEG